MSVLPRMGVTVWTLPILFFLLPSASSFSTNRAVAEITKQKHTTTTTTLPRSWSSSLLQASSPKVVQQQTAVLDGAEWKSLRTKLLLEAKEETAVPSSSLKKQKQQQSQPLPSYHRTEFGVYTIATGQSDGQRVCGLVVVAKTDNDTLRTVALDNDESVLDAESVVRIPDSVSNDAALWTMLQSLSLHTAAAAANNHHKNNVAVLGGNDLAVTSATALQQALHLSVTVVSSERPRGLPPAVAHVTPASAVDTKDTDDTDDTEPQLLGFSTALGHFDAILDILGDELDDTQLLDRLATRHGVTSYTACQTQAQQLIGRRGLLWGPGRVQEYVQDLNARAVRATAARFPSPRGWGQTVQTLLEAGFVWPRPVGKQWDPNRHTKNKNPGVYVRGWSLPDVWEYTTWPREAESGRRFGFPTDDDTEDEDEEMISAPPSMIARSLDRTMALPDNVADHSNPYVMGVSGIQGLQAHVIRTQRTGVLFLSAPFCRTCRYLTPQYQRMARQFQNEYGSSGSSGNDDSEDNDDIVFVKADAVGKVGKELGHFLEVDSVPSFLLFRDGKRYGKPMSLSRLPSRKLDKALDYLREGKSWSDAELGDEDGGGDGATAAKDSGGFAGGTGQAKPSRNKI